MDGPLSLFALCSLCETCPVRELCGAERTQYACRETQGLGDPGGDHVLHPRSVGLAEWESALDGLGFDQIHARPVQLPPLPSYIPQVENNLRLSGFLNDSTYAIRWHDAIRQGRVVPAAEIRARLGLRAEQPLVLLPFDRDELLERIWDRITVREIAEADYTLVASPSYSAWTPRPRTELLVNAKRSLSYFQALQDAGARAVPRVVWETERDVERFAGWVEANPCIELVALDLQTYRANRDWEHQLKGLARFDRTTGTRLAYLVNGPTVIERCRVLLEVIPAERLHLTNATAQVGLRVPRRGRSLLTSIRDPGRRFVAQSQAQTAMVTAAVDSHRSGISAAA
jgi:hypothetical protein